MTNPRPMLVTPKLQQSRMYFGLTKASPFTLITRFLYRMFITFTSITFVW